MNSKKRFFATAFTLSGTTIGAGILGMPYVFSKSGFFVGVFWLALLGGIMLLINLYLGEISLRTRKFHQLPGYAGEYLGKTGKRIMFFAVVFGIYSALLAYLIGEGQSLSKLFFGHFDYSIYFVIGFWVLMTLLLREGLKELKRVEFYGVIAIIVIVLVIFFSFFPQINLGNLNHFDLSNFFFPFGVIIFAMLGFSSIPELRQEIRKHEKLFKKAIILGTLIPIILYFIFTLVFVGVLGKNVQQVSTISFGNITIVLGIFTMLTSYFVLSFSLRDIFLYDIKPKHKYFVKKETLSFIFVSLIPLLLYLGVTFFNIGDFIHVLGIGGVISGGLSGILILIINSKAKKKGNRKPEFSIPINWILVSILSLVLIAGVVFELFF